MDDTDRLAAAIFAAAKCAASGNHEPKDYLDQYDEFIRLMNERNTALQCPTVNGDSPAPVSADHADKLARNQSDLLKAGPKEGS
jgi:hypothetical protein